MKKQTLTAFLTVITALSLSAQAHAIKLKIGFINSVTGPEAPIGENLSNGATLAVEDLKRKGIDVDLIREDDGSVPQKALSAFEKLVTRDNVVGIVGAYTSANVSAIAPRADQYKIPLLVPVAAKEDITRKGFKYVFRLNAPADVYSSVLMDAIRTLDNPKTIAFVFANTDFGNSTVATAKEYAAKLGLKIVGEEIYQKGQPDYRSILNKIKAQNPDLVFMVSYEADAILLMRQAKEIGLKPKAYLGAGAGFTTAQFLAQTEISDKVFAATQWTPNVPWSGAKQFEKTYVARFGKDPSYHAACAYEAIRIMAETANQAGGDREKTRAGLRAGTWDGIMGTVKFGDYNGFTNQNNHQMLVEQVINGRYETVFPAKYSTKKPVYPFSWK